MIKLITYHPITMNLHRKIACIFLGFLMLYLHINIIAWTRHTAGITSEFQNVMNNKYERFRPTPMQNVDAPETANIVMVIYGSEFYENALTLMKSILLLSLCKLNVYIFTIDDTVEKLNTEIKSWPDEFHGRIQFTKAKFHCPEWQANRAMNMSSSSELKICSQFSFRSLKTDHNIAKVIYIDGDFVALDDIYKLWQKFEDFQSNHTMSMSVATIRYISKRKVKTVTGNGYGLNAGLILINLDKLVEFSFTEGYLNSSSKVYNGLNPRDDQDLMNIYFFEKPEQLLLLSCDWNFRLEMDSCKDTLHTCETARTTGIGFIHATYPKMFTTGDYQPLYRCMRAIDFRNLRKTVNCLNIEVMLFKEKRTCLAMAHYLDRLQDSLKALQ